RQTRRPHAKPRPPPPRSRKVPGCAAASRAGLGFRERSRIRSWGENKPVFASLPGRMQISTNQFKNGSHIEVDGTVYRILEFQHVKPGKGGAFVRTKLRKVDDGSVQDKTFRA